MSVRILFGRIALMLLLMVLLHSVEFIAAVADLTSFIYSSLVVAIAGRLTVRMWRITMMLLLLLLPSMSITSLADHTTSLFGQVLILTIKLTARARPRRPW